MDMTNGGLYASPDEPVRHKEVWRLCADVSESGPLMTMLILGSAGLASFEPHHFVGAILPF